ncbi:Glutamyl-tRNA synthetase [Modicella reniformis]|uniref:Glutamyl-tRNA synthetase n=1 Tax=Modicella reniformis TaxID=1440133 RepID=A0A9P6J5Z8_9FUNG|nr:Glutamyl-tRNA synthetase [Modicella reniformis]
MRCHWNRVLARIDLECRSQASCLQRGVSLAATGHRRLSGLCFRRPFSAVGATTGNGSPEATRVRFAPSPTGYLHLGGLRTALYNHLLARQNGGKLVLRIEDTDQTRYVPGAAESLVRAMEWAGIQFDEGPGIGGPHEPYHQIPEGKTIVQDEVHGKVEFSNKEVDDSVLMKSDGYPTYHLANVVDDHLMGITHVIRGQEWLPSAPKHVILYGMFGWDTPKFAHVPLLLNTDKSKLSKRSGDVNVEDYRDKGYFPEAVVNFVALLGWHPGTTEEIFDMKGLTAAFTLNSIQQSNAVVIREKLDWINKMHLLRRAETHEGLKEMAAMLQPKIEADLGLLTKEHSDDYIARVISTLKERIKNIYDVPELCGYYFKTPTYTSEESIAYRKKIGSETLRAVLPMALERFKSSGSTELGSEDVKLVLKNIAAKLDLKLPVVMNALRYTVSGVKVGAGVPETLATLGRSCVIDRIERVLASVNASDD